MLKNGASIKIGNSMQNTLIDADEIIGNLTAQTSKPSLIAAMQSVAPPGLTAINTNTFKQLHELTLQLAASRKDAAVREYHDFLAITERDLNLKPDQLSQLYGTAKIVVTGGTGCIGTKLIQKIRALKPAKITCLSRGITPHQIEFDDVEYISVDICNQQALFSVFDRMKPDVVFHLAAQRDPSAAEQTIKETIETNIFGTANLIAASKRVGVKLFVFSSTGKAVRPLTNDVYAATKKASEAILSEWAAEGNCSIAAVRFTHVVDNSLIHLKIQQWMKQGQPIRLHGTEIAFYTQSAREAASLLLNAGLSAQPGILTIGAIRDLDWPMSLTNITLGALIENSIPVPIYFCGVEEGYQSETYPHLYDSRNSASISPLISSFEAITTKPSQTCIAIDEFVMSATNSHNSLAALANLSSVCRTDPSQRCLKKSLNELSIENLRSRLTTLPLKLLRNVVDVMSRIPCDTKRLPEHVDTDRLLTEALASRKSNSSEDRVEPKFQSQPTRNIRSQQQRRNLSENDQASAVRF